MANSQVTLRQLCRHIRHQPPSSFGLRELLGLKQGTVRLDIRKVPFSLMTQNMALRVAPATYLGMDRDAAVQEIINCISSLSPDVVGLCEVFADGERDEIRSKLFSLYPFFSEGPENSGLSDGGCLLLSKHPILAKTQLVYSDSVYPDSAADKGVLYIRIQPPMASRPHEIFYSHTQNIEEPGGKEALYNQLSEMGSLIQLVADPSNPWFAMGDLNIPGDVPKHYGQLVGRLGNPVDLWLVSGGSSSGGHTFVSNNNFYEDPADNPHTDHRLDYVLMGAGQRSVPILKGIEILKFKLNGRDLSDHFGLRARFEDTAEVIF